MNELFNRVRFHAVRRAMLENETVLEGFMDDIAAKYSDEKLELLDRLLVAISDNDLFDLMMSGKIPSAYGEEMKPLCEEMKEYAQHFSDGLKK